mgnify:CR=1 FL=1
MRSALEVTLMVALAWFSSAARHDGQNATRLHALNSSAQRLAGGGRTVDVENAKQLFVALKDPSVGVVRLTRDISLADPGSPWLDLEPPGVALRRPVIILGASAPLPEGSSSTPSDYGSSGSSSGGSGGSSSSMLISGGACLTVLDTAHLAAKLQLQLQPPPPPPQQRPQLLLPSQGQQQEPGQRLQEQQQEQQGEEQGAEQQPATQQLLLSFVGLRLLNHLPPGDGFVSPLLTLGVPYPTRPNHPEHLSGQGSGQGQGMGRAAEPAAAATKEEDDAEEDGAEEGEHASAAAGVVGGECGGC